MLRRSCEVLLFKIVCHLASLLDFIYKYIGHFYISMYNYSILVWLIYVFNLNTFHGIPYSLVSLNALLSWFLNTLAQTIYLKSRTKQNFSCKVVSNKACIPCRLWVFHTRGSNIIFSWSQWLCGLWLWNQSIP